MPQRDSAALRVRDLHDLRLYRAILQRDLALAEGRLERAARRLPGMMLRGVLGNALRLQGRVLSLLRRRVRPRC